MTKHLATFLFLIFLSTHAFADQVIMTNGDRLTGKIVTKDGDSVIIQTDAAGTVRIKWSAVAQIISDDPLTVTLADGNVVRGKIQSKEDEILIDTADSEKVTIKKDAVKIVRTAEEQKKFEEAQKRIQESRFTDFWSGTVDVGFSLTSGNSDTQTFSAALRGTRETEGKKLSVYANALQIKDTSNDVVRTKAQSIWAGARYDVDLNRKWFAFGSGDFEYNKPQKLDLRAVLGGGVGYHAVKNDRINLDLTTGVTNNYENYSTGVNRNSAELLVGQELKFRLNSRARLTERAIFYPNISRFGDARALLDASLQTDINNWLGWHFTVANRFNSRPIDLTEKNDFILSTGIRFSFGNKKKKFGK